MLMFFLIPNCMILLIKNITNYLDEKDYGYFIEEIMKKDYVKIVFTNGDPDLYVSKKDYVNLILENQ